MTQFQNPYAYTPRTNGIIWVQGIEGAKAYQLSPNSNIVLLDSENDGKFYIKVSDNIGMCTLRVFEYKEVSNTSESIQNVDMSKYVTKEELQQSLKELKEVKNNSVKSLI